MVDQNENAMQIHSGYEALMKDMVLEHLSHTVSTRKLWDEIWCHMLGNCVPPDVSARIRGTIERVALLYANALRCTTRLSRQQLEERYNGLVSQMHEMKAATNEQSPSQNVLPVAATADVPNDVVRLIRQHASLYSYDWIVPDKNKVIKGLTWRPACSVFGTDQIACTANLTYNARSSLLAAAWSMILLHPTVCNEFTTLDSITQTIYADEQLAQYDNSNAMQVQTQLFKWIYIRADVVHAETFNKHMSHLLGNAFNRDVYVSLAIQEYAFFVPFPVVYTAFVIDLLIETIGRIPVGVSHFYQPNATPFEIWPAFTRYHVEPPTREALLHNWSTEALVQLEKNNYVYNASKWDAHLTVLN